MPIQFFSEEIDFHLQDQERFAQWLISIAHQNDHEIVDLNYIFCSDEYLLKINKQYLDHDYYTDIITFDHSEAAGKTIEGDIFISLDRVRENAMDLAPSFQEELHRVIAHGILHLIGFNDKTDEEKEVMTEKENACLSLLKD